MEVFSNENGIPPPDQFPDKISPFPTSSESEPTPLLTFTPYTTPFPPQKLRPIRCNALVYNNNNTNTQQTVKLHADAGFVGQSSLEQVGFGELGLVSNHMRDELVAARVGGSKALVPFVAKAEMDVRSMTMEAEINKGKSLQPCSSSSSESEVSGELLENARGLHKRKRTRKSLQGYMEKFVSDVMLKQELMYNEVMEVLERKERERLMREEAWRQQEMEWRMRVEQVRTQETAQNVAIITFIQKQNILGQDFQTPQPLQIDQVSKVEAEVCQQKDD